MSFAHVKIAFVLIPIFVDELTLAFWYPINERTGVNRRIWVDESALAITFASNDLSSVPAAVWKNDKLLGYGMVRLKILLTSLL